MNNNNTNDDNMNLCSDQQQSNADTPPSFPVNDNQKRNPNYDDNQKSTQTSMAEIKIISNSNNDDDNNMNNNDSNSNKPRLQLQDGFIMQIDLDTGFLNVSTPFSKLLQNSIQSESNNNKKNKKEKNKNKNKNKNNKERTEDTIIIINDGDPNKEYKTSTDMETNTDATATITTTASSTTTTTTTTVKTNNEKVIAEEEKEELIPETVIQYQRQLRKVQAAQRASQPHPSLTNRIHVVYHDEHIVVVNKPSGLLSVPGLNHNPSMLSMVHSEYPPTLVNIDSAMHVELNVHDTTKKNTTNRYKKKRGAKVNKEMTMAHMTVHRLDMDTSGIILFARNRHSMSQLQKSFRTKTTPHPKPHPNQTQTPPKHPSPLSKTYEALVVGHVHPTVHRGTIAIPLQRDHRHPPFMRIASQRSEHEARGVVADLQHAGWKKLVVKRAKESVTDFRVLGREWLGGSGGGNGGSNGNGNGNGNGSGNGNGGTCVEEGADVTEKGLPVTRLQLTPITGRTHQLRVHCAAIGHPILADPAYGILGEACPDGGIDGNWTDAVQDGDGFLEVRPSVLLQREIDAWVREGGGGGGGGGMSMCLHARKLEVVHPVTGERMVFECAPPF